MTEKKDIVEDLIEKAKPLLSNLSFGAVMGYCSARALKTVGKALSVIIGVGFISLQTAVSAGFIEVDWEKIRVSFVKQIDSDADGQVTAGDAKAYWKKFKQVMTYKIPAAGGFSLGFLYGVRN
jgi:uncharacterized membrane protein (Fun14 family)